MASSCGKGTYKCISAVGDLPDGKYVSFIKFAQSDARLPMTFCQSDKPPLAYIIDNLDEVYYISSVTLVRTVWYA